MEKDGSILRKAKTRIGAKRTEQKAINLITEHLFNTEVKPLLEQLASDFLEREIPPIFFPLIEEVKELIETKEGKGLELEQDIHFWYWQKNSDYWEECRGRKAFTLSNIMESRRKNDRKILMDFLENNTLLEKLRIAVVVKFSGQYRSRYGGNVPEHVKMGFIYYNNNKYDKFYSNRLIAQVGSDRWDANVNSEEGMNELIEKVYLILSYGRKYLEPKHLAKISL